MHYVGHALQNLSFLWRSIENQSTAPNSQLVWGLEWCLKLRILVNAGNNGWKFIILFSFSLLTNISCTIVVQPFLSTACSVLWLILRGQLVLPVLAFAFLFPSLQVLWSYCFETFSSASCSYMSKFDRSHILCIISLSFQMWRNVFIISVTLCRYMGTIVGISDLDPLRWPSSKWRNLQVSTGILELNIV